VTAAESSADGAALPAVVAWLDAMLDCSGTPDYTGALNGLQFENAGRVHRIAAAVDASTRVITAAAALGADLLLVHHGLFWNGAEPVRGAVYAKHRLLHVHNIAVYSAHLPLDRHASLGNNVLLAQALGLSPAGTWLPYKGVPIGVVADGPVPTRELIARAERFASMHGHHTISTPVAADRISRRIAICSGGGASGDSIREALALGADTLITGEGPHYTAVAADDAGLAIIYAGHYATETLGVQALARAAAAEWSLPWDFVPAPTGL
jgi:dinuclear metal center YbgI/SA1388 family protein